MIRRARTLLTGLLAACVVLLSPAADAQRRKGPQNAPEDCPYCHGDPELMAAAGLVSHGGFEFAKTDTAGIDDLLATSDIRWIESEHFEIGFALGSYKLRDDERDKVRAECERLRVHLPDVPEKPRMLDPWLRAHLFAQRAEDVWDRMVELIGIDESKLPDGTAPWDRTGEYMGEGPYLGQKGKYEVLIVPSKAACSTFLIDQFGLKTSLTQRWNNFDRSTLLLAIHTDQGQLRVDTALHGHVAFNLVHNLYDGYRFYGYDTPIWVHEGLAHFVEREISPDYNSFDSAEGAIAEKTRKADWEPPSRKLATGDRGPSLAELVNLKSYSELKLEHHFKTWSLVDYLVRTRPAELARFLHGLKGFLDENGILDGSQVRDGQRQLFKEVFGMTYAQLDEAWKVWVLENY